MNNLIAHRGLQKNNEKENTIPSFINAINDVNYVGFECDIWTTSDGYFVIHHSPIYKLKLISTSKLKDLEGITTLKDLLKLKSNKIFLIEIKDLNINYDKLHNIINNEKNKNNYEVYDFICLLESVYTKNIHNYFKKQNIEVFLYGIHKDSSYSLKDLYFITDKVI